MSYYPRKQDEPFKTWTFDNACDSVELNKVVTLDFAISGDTSLVDECDLIIFGIQSPPKEDKKEDTPQPNLVGKAKELDDLYSGAIKEFMKDNYQEFKDGAKVYTCTPTLCLSSANGKMTKIVLLGLGEDKSKDGLFPKLGSTLASKCDSMKSIKKCSLVLPTSFSLEEKSARDISTEFYTSLYSDNRFRSGEKVQKIAENLEKVTIIDEGYSNNVGSSLDKALEEGKILATGVYCAKDIVNAPHNVMNSLSLANLARKIVEESNGFLTCTILGKEECEKRGMGAYLGVARGSETEPQFIHVTYKPKSGAVKKKVGVVGKGLLFDTGGYNIKVAMMELMKFDCGGAGAVLGAARAVAQLAPEGVEAHFITAACENMVNDRAIVPSDVLTASNGMTIEVLNTDAEGRLTLADALVYADKEVGCDSIIELSTLTGACLMSLGKKVCGVWTSDDDLASELSDVSKTTGERSWRMPLVEDYNEQLKSKIADISNLGERYGGAITAALFLQNFVDEKPYAHIDIAGPVWCDKTGATGFGAKLVTEWVSRQGI